MRGDAVAVIKLTVIGWQSPAILKVDAAIVDAAHPYQFTIRSAKIRVSAIEVRQYLRDINAILLA